MQDLTIILITANEISEHFAVAVQHQLYRASGDAGIICVSKKPVHYARNIVMPTPRTHFNIYRQALAGAKAATTKYIAIAEDDVLYSPKHFLKRPSPGKFAYNVACWAFFTWSKPAMFTYQVDGARRNHGMLICERELYIEAMEERFAKWPDDTKTNKEVWAEPGKYEDHLGVTVRESETFYTDPPNVKFSHPEELSYLTIGEKKRHGQMRAFEIPHWGRAEDIKRYYE